MTRKKTPRAPSSFASPAVKKVLIFSMPLRRTLIFMNLAAAMTVLSAEAAGNARFQEMRSDAEVFA
jgi:hypothetical protein